VVDALKIFTPEVNHARLARQFARQTLSEWDMESDEVVLVVSELSANAILHARSDFELSLSKTDKGVTVRVTDTHPCLPVVSSPNSHSMDGRGLMIINQLARQWGVRRTATGGKTVWAYLANSASLPRDRDPSAHD
jgi:anti-sigma regulatory factor (Ser/Thr protein kinase)